jgi:signal transduction histidine kinase
VKLVRRLQSDLPAVMGDAMQLEQAFLNLILNAVEAMPEGGSLTLTTRVKPAPAQVVVEFADTGAGKSSEQCSRAFRSVLNTTKAKGTGLGLAIVGRTIETHGGELDIKSQPGRGTTIAILFPAEHP